MRSGFEVPGGGKVCKYWSTDLWTSKPPIGQITSRTLRTINYCYSYLIYCTTKTGNPPSLHCRARPFIRSGDDRILARIHRTLHEIRHPLSVLTPASSIHYRLEPL
jgi:hypothetical protein